jgi:hypothetical protein
MLTLKITSFLGPVMVVTSGIPTFRRLSQEEFEFEASLAYIARPCFKKEKKFLLMQK